MPWEMLIAAIVTPSGIAIIMSVYQSRQKFWDRIAPNGCGPVVSAIALYIVFCFALWAVLTAINWVRGLAL